MPTPNDEIEHYTPDVTTWPYLDSTTQPYLNSTTRIITTTNNPGATTWPYLPDAQVQHYGPGRTTATQIWYSEEARGGELMARALALIDELREIIQQLQEHG